MQAVILDVGVCCCNCAYSGVCMIILIYLFIYVFFQQVRTGDLGGYATSDEFTRAVIANLAIWAPCLQICQLLRRIHAHWPSA